MLRINLLPAYIAEQRRTRMTIVLMSVLFVALLAALLGYTFGMLKPQVDQVTEEATRADEEATQVEALQADAQNIKSKIKPIEDKVAFVENVRFYNGLRPRIFRQVAKFTERQVEYSAMSAQADTLQVQAFVYGPRVLDKIAKFYVSLYNNPDIKTLSWRGMPSYPNNLNPTVGLAGMAPDPSLGGLPVQVTAQLLQPISAPVPPGGGASRSGGMGGMMGGMGMMMGGMGPGGPPGGMMGGRPPGGAVAPSTGGAGGAGSSTRSKDEG